MPPMPYQTSLLRPIGGSQKLSVYKGSADQAPAVSMHFFSIKLIQMTVLHPITIPVSGIRQSAFDSWENFRQQMESIDKDCEERWNAMNSSYIDDEDDLFDEGEIDITFETGEPGESIRERGPPLANRKDLMEKQFRAVQKCAKDAKLTIYQYLNGFWIIPPPPILSKSNAGTRADLDAYLAPRVFVWSPHLLEGVEIKCITCGHQCKANGYPDKPLGRLVIDMNDNYYIVPSKYKCGGKECGKQFNATNSIFLSQLPIHIKDIFPAFLTKRSGVDRNIIHQLRTSVGESLGMAPFRRMLWENHSRRFMTLRLNYLSKIATVRDEKSGPMNRYVTTSPPLDFPEFDGDYCGFVPSSKYLTEIFIAFILLFEQQLCAQIAKCSAEVLSVDHSHKVTKHIAKVNGHPLFQGLLSVTNEFEQINALFLCPSTSNDILKQMFQSLLKNLENFGNRQPRLLYIDNCCNGRDFYENTVDSLNEDVVKVQTSVAKKLPELTLDSNNSPILVEEPSSADDAVELLEQLISTDDEKTLCFGLDCEWSVNLQSGEHGHIALIQICAHNGKIVLFQTSKCALHQPIVSTSGKISTPGKLPLSFEIFLSRKDITFVGRNISADLKKITECFGIEFHKHIDIGSLAAKRTLVNNAGTSLAYLCEVVIEKHLEKSDVIRINNWDGHLTTAQVEYAAKDSLASLLVFQRLVEMPPVGDDVTQMNTGLGTKVAIFATTKSKQLVGYATVTELPSNWKAKKVFIKVTIDVIVAKNIKVTTTNGKKKLADIKDERLSVNLLKIADEKALLSASSRDSEETFDLPETQNCRHYTRVKLDPYHWMKRISELLDADHGCFHPFCRTLMAAVFVPDKSDEAKVRNVLEKTGRQLEQQYEENLDWMKRRIRRSIPEPAVLENRVRFVLDHFKDQQDATSGDVFIDKATMSLIEKQFVHIRKGCLSDPPDMSLYFAIGKDKYGLVKYRCIRGTNSNEGTVHKTIRAKFGAFNAGPLLSYCMLLDFATRNNMRAASRNKGEQDYGHFDPWILDETVAICQKLEINNPLPAWICTDQTEFDNNFILGPYHAEGSLPSGEPLESMTTNMKFLARKMKLKVPVTPVHTKEEMALYKKLKLDNNSEQAKILEGFVDNADGKKIFYKLPHHLEKHDKFRASAANRKATMAPLDKVKHIQFKSLEQDSLVRNTGTSAIIIDGNEDENFASNQPEARPELEERGADVAMNSTSGNDNLLFVALAPSEVDRIDSLNADRNSVQNILTDRDFLQLENVDSRQNNNSDQTYNQQRKKHMPKIKAKVSSKPKKTITKMNEPATALTSRAPSMTQQFIAPQQLTMELPPPFADNYMMDSTAPIMKQQQISKMPNSFAPNPNGQSIKPVSQTFLPYYQPNYLPGYMPPPSNNSMHPYPPFVNTWLANVTMQPNPYAFGGVPISHSNNQQVTSNNLQPLASKPVTVETSIAESKKGKAEGQRYSQSRKGYSHASHSAPTCSICRKPLKAHDKTKCHSFEDCTDPECHPESFKQEIRERFGTSRKKPKVNDNSNSTNQ